MGRYHKEGYHTGPTVWESIPGLLKRPTNTGSGFAVVRKDVHKCRLYLERDSMALRDTILLVSSPQGMDSVRLKKEMFNIMEP
jgi:hypothetical protein